MEGTGIRLLIDQQINVKIRNTPLNGGLVSRWSPDCKRVAYLVTTNETADLWMIDSDGSNPKETIEDVEWFDWFPDNRHMIISRRFGSEFEMFSVNLDSGQEQTLLVGPLIELDVAPDGGAVSFCFGRSHMSMGLAVLKLEQATDPLDPPRAVGEPKYVVRAEGSWHVHNGVWSSDSKSLVLHEGPGLRRHLRARGEPLSWVSFALHKIPFDLNQLFAQKKQRPSGLLNLSKNSTEKRVAPRRRRCANPYKPQCVRKSLFDFKDYVVFFINKLC